MNGTFDLKKSREEYSHWNAFKFEIVWSNTGVARIWINDRKTKYSAGGYGYCKESAVLGKMINDLIGQQNYDEQVYGNYKGLLSQGGVGTESIINSFETIGGKLEKLYSGKSSNVFSIKFPETK